MRYFQGIPEDFLRESFKYDPTAPSGLIRLVQTQRMQNATHVHKMKNGNGFIAEIKIDGKKHRKYFSFGKNGMSQKQAQEQALAFIFNIQLNNPQLIKPVGYKNKLGYWQAGISYKGKFIGFSIHRLIRFFERHKGKSVNVQNKQIDHIDNDRSNNNVQNLRISTPYQNAQNTKLSKRNKTGIKGLYDDQRNLSFRATVSSKGKLYRKYFSYRLTPSLKDEIKTIATNWLRKIRTRLHKNFTNHGDQP